MPENPFPANPLSTVVAQVTALVVELRERTDAAGEQAQARLAELPAEIAEMVNRFSPDELRKVAEAYLAVATSMLNALSDRGEEVVDRLRAQPIVGLTEEALGTISTQTRAVGERAAAIAGLASDKPDEVVLPAAKKSPASKAAPAKKAPATKAPATKSTPAKATAQKTPAKKTAAKKAAPAAKAAPAKKAAPVKKGTPAKTAAPVRKAAPAKKAPAKKAAATKATAQKATANKAAAKKAAATKATAQKATANKAAAKKAPATKAPAKKAAPKKA